MNNYLIKVLRTTLLTGTSRNSHDRRSINLFIDPIILYTLVEQSRDVALFLIDEKADISPDFVFFRAWKSHVGSNLTN